MDNVTFLSSFQITNFVLDQDCEIVGFVLSGMLEYGGKGTLGSGKLN